MGTIDMDLQSSTMILYDNRLSSFTKDWPFKGGCGCPPEKMAAAGFYHCPSKTEPDLVKCAFCSKELDGWEPEDDPWEEHKKHSKRCPYLKDKYYKDPNGMTIEELLKLECERLILFMNNLIDSKIAYVKEYAAQGRENLNQLRQG